MNANGKSRISLEHYACTPLYNFQLSRNATKTSSLTTDETTVKKMSVNSNEIYAVFLLSKQVNCPLKKVRNQNSIVFFSFFPLCRQKNKLIFPSAHRLQVFNTD